ncbi:MAG: ABC transporter permease, partial [Desulfobacteraceae bacterium]|nr:ABC transporter permease [Desulfobacteraceae bacterium]
MRAMSPGQRRWRRFRANRRGLVSLVIFLVLLATTLAAELVSNDKPLLVIYQGRLYFPILRAYPETTFGGDFATEADYQDPFVRQRLSSGGNHVFFPPNPYGYDSIDLWHARP